LSRLRRYYENPILRRQVLERLSLKFWWNNIQTGRSVNNWSIAPFGIRIRNTVRVKTSNLLFKHVSQVSIKKL
jgi:hypothetical protein